MSRKNPSFRQLAWYMLSAEGAKLGLLHNLPTGTFKASRVIDAFEENHGHLPPRANGNALYHEIIALPPDSPMSRARQVTVLRRLAARYVEQRAPRQLVFGIIHTDTPHLHMHLMVSSNPVLSRERVRLGKAEFARIQAGMEREQARDFPELGETRHYGLRARERVRQPWGEQRLVKRSGRRSDKELVAELLDAALSKARNEAELQADLASAGVELYRRGTTVGVRTRRGRRYRLRTLGLATRYAEAAARFELADDRAMDLARLDERAARRFEAEDGWELER